MPTGEIKDIPADGKWSQEIEGGDREISYRAGKYKQIETSSISQ